MEAINLKLFSLAQEISSSSDVNKASALVVQMAGLVKDNIGVMDLETVTKIRRSIITVAAGAHVPAELVAQALSPMDKTIKDSFFDLIRTAANKNVLAAGLTNAPEPRGGHLKERREYWDQMIDKVNALAEISFTHISIDDMGILADFRQRLQDWQSLSADNPVAANALRKLLAGMDRFLDSRKDAYLQRVITARTPEELDALVTGASPFDVVISTDIQQIQSKVDAFVRYCAGRWDVRDLPKLSDLKAMLKHMRFTVSTPDLDRQIQALQAQRRTNMNKLNLPTDLMRRLTDFLEPEEVMTLQQTSSGVAGAIPKNTIDILRVIAAASPPDSDSFRPQPIVRFLRSILAPVSEEYDKVPIMEWSQKKATDQRMAIRGGGVKRRRLEPFEDARSEFRRAASHARSLLAEFDRQCSSREPGLIDLMYRELVKLVHANPRLVPCVYTVLHGFRSSCPDLGLPLCTPMNPDIWVAVIRSLPNLKKLHLSILPQMNSPLGLKPQHALEVFYAAPGLHTLGLRHTHLENLFLQALQPETCKRYNITEVNVSDLSLYYLDNELLTALSKSVIAPRLTTLRVDCSSGVDNLKTLLQQSWFSKITTFTPPCIMTRQGENWNRFPVDSMTTLVAESQQLTNIRVLNLNTLAFGSEILIGPGQLAVAARIQFVMALIQLPVSPNLKEVVLDTTFLSDWLIMVELVNAPIFSRFTEVTLTNYPNIVLTEMAASPHLTELRTLHISNNTTMTPEALLHFFETAAMPALKTLDLHNVTAFEFNQPALCQLARTKIMSKVQSLSLRIAFSDGYNQLAEFLSLLPQGHQLKTLTLSGFWDRQQLAQLTRTFKVKVRTEE